MAIALWVVSAVSGCGDRLGESDPRPRPATPPVPSPPGQHNQRLKAEVLGLRGRVNDLSQRSSVLEKKVRELTFLNEQLTKQLGAVGNAPGERDKYRSMVAAQQLKIAGLQKRIAELEKHTQADGSATSQPSGDSE